MQNERKEMDLLIAENERLRKENTEYYSLFQKANSLIEDQEKIISRASEALERLELADKLIDMQKEIIDYYSKKES